MLYEVITITSYNVCYTKLLRLSPTQLGQDIRTLWKLNKYSDIQITYEDVDGGIILTIHVTEKPSIKSIVVHGNRNNFV